MVAKNMVIEEAIKEIVTQRGIAVLNNPVVFCAILDDIVPHLEQDRKIFRRALTEKAASQIKDAYSASGKEREIILSKLDIYFMNELGLSREWSNQIILNFAKAFNWEYVTKISYEKETLPTEKPMQLFDDISVLSKTIATGSFHTLAIRENGTVIATGDNRAGQCNVSNWKDIVAVAADAFHSVGLKSDGTVVATPILEPNKKFDVGQCNVANWKNIVDIAVGNAHTVGLKSDGTVVATGGSRVGQCEVSNWKDIVAISARGVLTLGLKSDGTVVAAGSNNAQQCLTNTWRNIIAVSAGAVNSIGLTKEGTLVTTKYVGNNYHGQCEISNFKDIVMVSANSYHTLGLKSDGTAVSTAYVGDPKFNHNQCEVSGWTDIVAVAASGTLSVGLKKDGTLVAMGDNHYGQCNVSGWKLFYDLSDYVSSFESRKEVLYKKLQEEKRLKKEKMDGLLREQSQLKEELSTLKGLFTGRRRKEIEERLSQIEEMIGKM